MVSRLEQGQFIRPFPSHPSKIRAFALVASPNGRISKRHIDDQIPLNSSNGWPHERHQQIDLHAVDPNSLRTSVSRESQ